MKYVHWLFSQVLLIGVIYFGLYKDIQQAYWILCFLIGLMTLGSFAYLTDDYIIKTLIGEEKGKRTIPKTLDAMYDLGITCTLIWFGAFWLAGFYIITVSCQTYGYDKAKKLMEN